MDIFLFIIIFLQFAYIFYRDVSSVKERESLQLKLMSRDVGEYRSITENKPEQAEQEEDPYIPVEEATIEQILKATE